MQTQTGNMQNNVECCDKIKQKVSNLPQRKPLKFENLKTFSSATKNLFNKSINESDKNSNVFFEDYYYSKLIIF